MGLRFVLLDGGNLGGFSEILFLGVNFERDFFLSVELIDEMIF